MKIRVGDFVGCDYLKKFGYVIHDRGGHVGRWKIRGTDGDDFYASSRDLRVITQAEMSPTTRPAVMYVTKLTTEQKLDLLLEHLGLEIESEPKVVSINEEGE